MADSVELRMSVASIKRVDPYAKDILAKSTHVALYKFNQNNDAWEKTETEGALFLYSRNGEPFHSIMIMNRLNTDNLIEPIVKEFEYQMQAPFLLYKNSKTKIFGIWFYNREECVQLAVLLETVMESVRENNADIHLQSEDVDIFRLLSRAQEDFNKTPKKSEQPQPKFSTPRAPDVTSQSVMDFFAQASGKSVTKPVNAPEVEMHFTLQRLMSNPVHTVEHIEKQQRSTTPQEQVLLRKKGGNNSSADRRSVPINFQTSSDKKENGLNYSRVSPQHSAPITSPLTAFITQKQKDDRDASSPLAQFLETPQKPALMPPMMFASSSNKQDKVDNLLLDNKTKNVEPLTKNQMIQALSYMLKTDSEFVTKLHEAYVKSLAEMVNQNVLN